MSYSLFKEVTVSNPGSGTRYGSDDLLEVMKILNAKIVSNRRPEIINPWRWSSWQELKQITEASVTTPSESNVVHLFLSATDNKVKVKKSGGTIINLEDVGSGTWSASGTETITNKTIGIDTNTIKHSTTNAQGDIMFYDTTATKYIRLAKGTANQSLTVNSAGTSLEWQTVTGGGGGGEANTASNVGSAGIGVWYQKSGVDLQFKSLFSPDGSIQISDDTGNQKIDFTVAGGLVKTNQTNTYGDFQQTFRSGKLAVTNPANTFAYFLLGSAITASRNVGLPLLTGNDMIVMENHAATLLNKTMSSGCIMNTDVVTLKHSITNTSGEILVNNGTKFDRLAKGAPDTFLKVNSSGTDVTWATPSTFGGVKLPDGTIAPTTGRWGAFFGGAGDGMGIMGFVRTMNRIYGSASSSSESATEIYTAVGTNAIAEYKTGTGFRRDSSCIFKCKWYLTSTSACKVKIGLSDAQALPAGGTGSSTTVYDVLQNSTGHIEMDGGITRLGVRFNSNASGLNQAVTEVLVRYRRYGTPSGQVNVGIRKNSDGTFVSLGSFTPTGSQTEQTATINASSNTYLMQTSDYVSVEFPSSSTDGIELDQSDASSPAGYTSMQYTGTLSILAETIGMRIRTTAGGGTSGDTPLNNANGIMVHGTIGTHTNYQISRNNANPTATVADSGKALANTSTHTLEINLNTTNIVVTVDGTPFTYTTPLPGTATPMAWFMHIESATVAEKGLGIVYSQVVMAS